LLVVRPARSIEDVEKLVELWVKLMDDSEASDLKFILDDDAKRIWVEYMVRAYIENPESILVAEYNGILAGFIASRSYSFPFKLREKDRYAVITDLYVVPEYRGKGIGRRLLEECLSRLKSRGYSRVRITVWVGNRRAIKLYSRSGFKPRFIVMEKIL